jgi:cell division protein ZapE
MTPLAYYQEQCQKGVIVADKAQLLVMQQIDALYHALILEHKKRKGRLAFLRKPKLVRGLYLWGGVGIGKTFLMDCLYHCLPFSKKTRMHFHQFMQWVHQELKNHQGDNDPLLRIADKVAKKTDLLCFDELVVAEITDAMLLGRLLNALFARGVCIVATSNIEPDELYKKGLQRQLFLPTIASIKQHTHVIHVPITLDYRLRHLKTAGVFFSANDEEAEEDMEKCFALLTAGSTVSKAPLHIHDRSINIIKQAGDVVWFDFDSLCHVPRSQHDYLAIAKIYRTVFISHVPVIPASAKNHITLFIHLIDVLYDARVRLVMSAKADIEKIYTEGHLAFEYQRTRSRLLEMQSEGYFSQ